jgi:transposase
MTEDESVPAAFAGVDWATEKHDACIVDPGGRVLGERVFAADAVGLAAMADWLAERSGAPPDRVAVAIEVPHGPVVEALLERGFAVHSINPKQLDRFRDRFTVAGAKDDSRDARVLADSLRTDGRAYRRLSNDDPDVIELREWSRMAADLTRDDTQMCNQARQQLLRFFPQVLELSGDVGATWILELLEAIPTPAAAWKRRVATIETIVRAHRIRRWKADEILAVLRKPALTVAPGTVEAATAHLRQIAARIRLVRSQLAECHDRIDAICARMGAAHDAEVEGRKNEPRDVEILLSLPGVGRIVAASLLAEASRPLREGDYQALRTLSGVAPVTRRSGKSVLVGMRRACNPRLRNALYHWARVAAQVDPGWKARYAALRARGRTHGHACRAVADSLLRVLLAMLRSRTLYDPARRAAKAVA